MKRTVVLSTVTMVLLLIFFACDSASTAGGGVTNSLGMLAKSVVFGFNEGFEGTAEVKTEQAGGQLGGSDKYYSIKAKGNRNYAVGGWQLHSGLLTDEAFVDYSAYKKLTFYVKLPSGVTALPDTVQFHVKMESGKREKDGKIGNLKEKQLLVSPPADPAKSWQVKLTNSWQKVTIPLEEFTKDDGIDLKKISSSFLYVLNSTATGDDAQKTALKDATVHLDEINFDKTVVVKPEPTTPPKTAVDEDAYWIYSDRAQTIDWEAEKDGDTAKVTFNGGYEGTAVTDDVETGGYKSSKYRKITHNGAKDWSAAGWSTGKKADGKRYTVDLSDYAGGKLVFAVKSPKATKMRVKLEHPKDKLVDGKEVFFGKELDVNDITTEWQEKEINLADFKSDTDKLNPEKLVALFVAVLEAKDDEIHIDEIRIVKPASN